MGVNVNYYGWPKECKANRGKGEKGKKKKNPNSKTLVRRLQTQNREDKETLNPSQKAAKP